MLTQIKFMGLKMKKLLVFITTLRILSKAEFSIESFRELFHILQKFPHAKLHQNSDNSSNLKRHILRRSW